MKRICWALFCLICGAIGASFARPYVCNNSDLTLIIITVFSVFAGFLIAIITLIGDPLMIKEGSWRVAELGHDSMRGSLLAHIVLFTLYLFVIGLLFVAVIVEKATLGRESIVKDVIEWVYLFFSISSFLLTFGLPVSLWNMQKARLEAEIDRRRKQEGLPVL